MREKPDKPQLKRSSCLLWLRRKTEMETREADQNTRLAKQNFLIFMQIKCILNSCLTHNSCTTTSRVLYEYLQCFIYSWVRIGTAFPEQVQTYPTNHEFNGRLLSKCRINKITNTESGRRKEGLQSAQFE